MNRLCVLCEPYCLFIAHDLTLDYTITSEPHASRPSPTPDASFLEAYRAGLVGGTLPRKQRNPIRRHVSAVESLNLKSPPPQGKVFADLIRGRTPDPPVGIITRCRLHVPSNRLLLSNVFSFFVHTVQFYGFQVSVFTAAS